MPPESREDESTLPIRNAPLATMGTPTQRAYQFAPAHCFELLRGHLYDANYEFFPLPKPSVPHYEYQVDILLPADLDNCPEDSYYGESAHQLVSFHSPCTLTLPAQFICIGWITRKSTNAFPCIVPFPV